MCLCGFTVGFCGFDVSALLGLLVFVCFLFDCFGLIWMIKRLRFMFWLGWYFVAYAVCRAFLGLGFLILGLGGTGFGF